MLLDCYLYNEMIKKRNTKLETELLKFPSNSMKIKFNYGSINIRLISSKSLGINGQPTDYNVAPLHISRQNALQELHILKNPFKVYLVRLSLFVL